MIREAIGIGETEELAKNDALKQLGVQNDNGVEFEIIKKAEKKRFGLFGGSPAKVKAFINIDEDIKESFTEEQNADKGKAPVKDTDIDRIVEKSFAEPDTSSAEAVKDEIDDNTAADVQTESNAHSDYKPAKDDGTPQDGEEGIGTGQPWDNQFWIAANRELSTGEVTVIKFKYKATTAARTSTQAHKMGEDGKPCTYLNWQAIGDVNFTEEWQDYEKEFTVPEGDNGMMSIVFNLAEVKYADDYYFKDFQWYVKDAALEADGKTMENLIKATGAENFWIKENKGNPESAATGISTVVAGNKKASNVTYNLAGQRVSNDYKGIVVKNGKKVVNK